MIEDQVVRILPGQLQMGFFRGAQLGCRAAPEAPQPTQTQPDKAAAADLAGWHETTKRGAVGEQRCRRRRTNGARRLAKAKTCEVEAKCLQRNAMCNATASILVPQTQCDLTWS
jgi:hypothetical protein